VICDWFDRAHALLNDWCYMKLSPTETELIGRSEMVDGLVRADATCQRIEWLTSSYLEKIATSKDWGGWETLFRDLDDGRYWERTYPQSEMHGGGPPRLTALSAEKAHAKYEFA
jgi:Immunity protein 27